MGNCFGFVEYVWGWTCRLWTFWVTVFDDFPNFDGGLVFGCLLGFWGGSLSGDLVSLDVVGLV